MARTNGPIQVFHRGDTIPLDAEGGYAGGDSTAAAVGTSLAQSGQAVATVDNLAATATTLPPGSPATATVTGPMGAKVVNFSIPRGADGAPGMGHEEGQQLLAQNQTTLTAAQAAQADANEAATRAENAEAAKLEVPDTNVTALVGNKATGTRGAIDGLLGSAQQPDYAGLLKGMSPYTQMTVTRVNGGNDCIVTCISPAAKAIKYEVGSSTRYKIIASIKLGSALPGKSAWTWPEVTSTGTFVVPSSSSTGYTTSVGASWQVSVTTTGPGQSVHLQTYVDNRGGVWNLQVVETGQTATLSTWATTGSFVTTTPFVIAAAGTYTFKATFAGADPANAPSGGTARGWLLRSTDTLVSLTASSAPDVTISPSSNRDMAIRFRPEGSTAAYDFIPYHGFEVETKVSLRFFVSGAEVDPATLPLNSAVPATAFEVVQTYKGHHSATPSTELVEWTTKQRITPDALLTISGQWRTLQPIQISSAAYHGMLMVDPTLFDELVSSRGVPTDVYPAGASPIMPALTDDVDGHAFLSSTHPDWVAAVSYDGRGETIRSGQPSKEAPDARSFLELRAGGGLAKVYHRLYADGTLIPAGKIHRFNARYWHGEIPGIRSTLTAKP